MKGRKEEERTVEEKLFSGVLWLNAKVFGLTLGLVCGLALFLATNWLVIKGGKPVGPHLALLSQYFIGYRVSFLGSVIGLRAPRRGRSERAGRVHRQPSGAAAGQTGMVFLRFCRGHPVRLFHRLALQQDRHAPPMR